MVKFHIFFVVILLFYAPHSFAEADVEEDYVSVSPDLSFDGFGLAIAPLGIQLPTGDCADIQSDIAKYKIFEKQNTDSIYDYFTKVQKIMGKWHAILKVYEGKFSKDSFLPMLELVQNINEVVKVIEANSVKVDDFIYDYSDIFARCSGSGETLGLLEIYSGNIFSTQSEVWRYLQEVSALVDLEEKKYKKLTDSKKTTSKFGELAKLSSFTQGSSGLGEMSDLYKQVLEIYYDVEFKKITKKIEEAIDVERRDYRNI